ncbi:hypothetical protein MNBD_CHLOROFLEXI01-4340 [hydrothermal vent metagenome]|uniref:Uncharacterized protein n=1 Tax=hydrothermal vent metagenome TaxID=652676 RepID=A0A3B0VHT9_9ZZZZ
MSEKFTVFIGHPARSFSYGLENGGLLRLLAPAGLCLLAPSVHGGVGLNEIDELTMQR